MNAPNHISATIGPRFNTENGQYAWDEIPSPNRILLFVGKMPRELNEKRNENLLAVDDYTGAFKAIRRLSKLYGVQPAAVIVLAGSNTDSQCAVWSRFYAEHPEFMTIPFFLMADEISESLKGIARKYEIVDDIINSQKLESGIYPKIQFVSRVKRLKLEQQGNIVVTHIPYNKSLVSNFLKRSLDVLAAGTGLLIASPAMLVIAGLIRLESKGPIFYASPRAGRNYKVFKFYKFRTMVPDADKQLDKLKHLNQYDTNEAGPVFYKVSNDPRITKLGNFLRNTSLDELPQLVNVLKGDMSLVGNRPLPLYEAKSLTTDSWVERFLAPAGITGLWQISKRGRKEMSVEERINLDIDYAYRNSFTYDMWLMINTPRALIQKDNV